ncbi:hypothetical protein C3B44_07610 [Corynebacterium yudongzhengii]|uniref:Septum formation initiator family protein n=1 Tax=Corynebacterium yudongzhengii TaxID=2080740 RepID=A0A2U1T6R1_9CORY|nr:septum formation initiator family protein [Corynebacterium yudongzhengii]AWB82237.1 hypothetical protein C3B44_07610 [Corynebacterium yudongzhengii]PWC01686.1 septum formation initiator family protein [Corynebacterium yudongzhengii]
MAARFSQRTRVPVSDRSSATRRSRPARKAGKAKGRSLDVPSLAVIGVVVLLILGAIYVPLKNYFDGRTEIARLHESIAAKEAQKEQLQDEIAQYDDEEFVRQEARRRLGVIEPGETAWRVVDPRMDPEDQVTTSSTDAEIQPEWYEVLWDSVATPPSPAAEMHLPVQ